MAESKLEWNKNRQYLTIKLDNSFNLNQEVLYPNPYASSTRQF